MPQIIVNGIFQNTLIVSPPGCGKTTLLRDIVRLLSNGIKTLGFSGKNVSLIDERGEIASCYEGVPTLDIGIRTAGQEFALILPGTNADLAELVADRIRKIIQSILIKNRL